MKKNGGILILFILAVAGFIVISMLNQSVYQIFTIFVVWSAVLYVVYRLGLLAWVSLRREQRKP
ncbi:hypothetical protein LH991_07700 [Schleiferilactobacillus harbinensis]|uniref:Uncharacterized protein n=1 Tax=Schleiferilactobacillus harbinensis DSM 16991 TaxID=1122147 RepID=A0A0R1XQX9_9LACO|nr:hypothetical protein [Schleiferilactobacillus harbinensis]KRM30137.1 hypothetical protein FC91_GL002952 [Schleiferilactobacillus harbinensis DSM 16991]QFR63867.1 hypothetical protein LH991_07700 [Schleiferilactobacillus harbinensis]